MRKIALLLAAAGLGLAGPASAADLGTAPVYTKAPAPTWSWTGGYLGLYLGGAGGGDVSTTIPTAPAATASYDFNSSFIGGYTSGYNLQFAPNWLIGYEGETGYMKVKASTIFPAPNANINATASLGSLYSVWSGRLGYVADKSLFYAKAGAVWVRADGGVNSIVPAAGLVSGHKNMFGYAVGGGWEYAFAPKWSVKAEYLYLGLDQSFTYGNTVSGFATTHVSGVHTGKVGVNYQFDFFNLLR